MVQTEVPMVKSVTVLADLGSMGDWLGNLLYAAGQQANEAVQIQLSSLSPTRFAFNILFHFSAS